MVAGHGGRWADVWGWGRGGDWGAGAGGGCGAGPGAGIVEEEGREAGAGQVAARLVVRGCEMPLRGWAWCRSSPHTASVALGVGREVNAGDGGLTGANRKGSASAHSAGMLASAEGVGTSGKRSNGNPGTLLLGAPPGRRS